MIIIMLRVCVFLLNQTGPTVEAGHMLSTEVLVKEQAAAAKSAAAKKSTATAPKLATAKKINGQIALIETSCETRRQLQAEREKK